MPEKACKSPSETKKNREKDPESGTVRGAVCADCGASVVKMADPRKEGTSFFCTKEKKKVNIVSLCSKLAKGFRRSSGK
ncbi:hypothetical protein AKJ58_00480 [candidate division MSBL1 archaeon SCGC-AAA385D11]|uniref:Uncharacterized protein n=1 Tax=candidate division MSBL1 archaeon SCGC-AAA385D11 TaxID=1698286 RepID=A0A133VPB0_9EURY|nr:hypothetical protein AKJ58_00480 [candidate division MSBL1 archaeon SCGC-AAA385D11]